MKHLKFLGIIFLSALVMALFEVQVEGANGWAGDLPTWKVTLPLEILGFGGKEKPLTGYHFYLWLFAFILPHFTFINRDWTWKKEFGVISFYILFTTFEGILWFGVNPAFGWDKFIPGNILWYKEPWLLLPVEYWIRFGIGVVTYIISIWDSD